MICVKLVNLSAEFGGIIAIFGFLNDRCPSNNSLHMKKTVVRNQATPHPLFDPEFYLARYPDVASSGLDPFAHFLTRGALEHRSPHPLFDARYYVENNSDVAKSGSDPLLHFLETGAFEGRKPIPLFDPLFYFEHNPEVAAQRINPLIHYLESGASQGRDPHPLFDTDWYVSQHPEVVASGMNPLVHYVLTGAQNRYKPNPNLSGPEVEYRCHQNFGSASFRNAYDGHAPQDVPKFAGVSQLLSNARRYSAIKPARKAGSSARKNRQICA